MEQCRLAELHAVPTRQSDEQTQQHLPVRFRAARRNASIKTIQSGLDATISAGDADATCCSAQLTRPLPPRAAAAQRSRRNATAGVGGFRLPASRHRVPSPRSGSGCRHHEWGLSHCKRMADRSNPDDVECNEGNPDLRAHRSYTAAA
jgi:hypothetical protein